MLTEHRKERRSFNVPGHAHYLTFSCYHRLPLLCKDVARRWVIEGFQRARVVHGFDMYAYVIMPEHVHVLVHARRAEYRISDFLYAVKKSVAWKAKSYLQVHNLDSWLHRLSVGEGSRRVFRFWEAGGGFDRNILYETALQPIADYIHNNPVRRELVDNPLDWQWSSARFWAGMRPVLVEMDPLPR